MKHSLLVSLMIALAGVKAQAGGVFSATYLDTDGLDQIGSQNMLTFYWDFDPAGSTTWTWAVFGSQGNWYYCNYDGDIWGELTTITDDGTNLVFSTEQFGNGYPNAITTGNSISNVVFAGGATSVVIDLDLDPSGNLHADAVSGTSSTSVKTSTVTDPVELRLTSQLLSNGDMLLSCVGISGTAYALERTFNLKNPIWAAQTTNTAHEDGLVIFTNTPVRTLNNFWRVRSVE